MHAPLNLSEIILMLAMGGEDNPLKSLPEDAKTITLKQLEDFHNYWLGRVINHINETGIMRGFSLEDMSEIIMQDDNPLLPLAEQRPEPQEIPREIFEQYIQWYSNAIAAYIKAKLESKK